MKHALLSINYPRLFFLAIIGFEMFCLMFVSSGCWETVPSRSSLYCLDNPAECGEGDGGTGGLSEGENGLPILNLPLPDGYVSQCTQGPGGSYSHHAVSTEFGVDLDTNNYALEGVYAPVSGTVYVHGSPNSQSGFGYHLNISVGDGLYVVIGHMEEIVVETGDEVVAGQFLGIEGCSGNCTGDHVHLGLSEGNPSESADGGASVPFALRARDATEGGIVHDIPAEDLVCALSGGHRYESQLEVSNWHPDGMLLSVPGESSVYVADQGRLHAWSDEQVMFSYGFWYEDIVPMAPRERDCWDMGSPITEETCYRAVKEGQGFWLAYECENNPGRSRLPIPGNAITAVMTSWGIESAVDSTTEMGAILMSYPEGMGTARLRDGALVREAAHSTVYAVNEGVALPILNWDVLVSMGLLHRDILVVPDGALEDAVLGVGSCPSHPSCIDMERIRQCGGVIDITDVVDGGAGGSDDLPDGPSDDDDDTLDTECDADTDGDGVPDCEDNCPMADNDQGDIDHDGAGDSCDPDIDGDGIENALDCAPFDASVGFCPESACGDGLDNDHDGATDCGDSDCGEDASCVEPDLPETDDDDLSDDDDVADDDDSTEEPDLSDDDDVADDDDATPPSDDDDATVEPPDPEDTPEEPPVTTSGVLVIEYAPPALLAPYTYIELSGEYTLANGSLGFPWTTGLVTVVNSSTLTFVLPGVSSGDGFRFSLEYYDAPMSVLSWGCLGPSPYTAQGTLAAAVDGAPVPVNLVNNFLGGCEDFVSIP